MIAEDVAHLKMMGILDEVKITVGAKGKLGGEVIGSVYVTRRKPIHIMRRTGGTFGISVDVLKKLKALEVKYIVFMYFGKRERCLFITTMDEYMNSDIEYTDVGNDVQKHVKLRDMLKIDNVELWKYVVKVLNHEGMKKLVEEFS